MHSLSTRQWLVLVTLTVVWGLNWPVLKLGVTGYPPLTYRLLCLLIGTPVLGLALLAMKVPLRIERAHWPELLRLSVFNMFIWHALMILAVQLLSSGRSAILGYTMPIFSAVLGVLFFSNRMTVRAWAGVAASSVGVAFLLWHEFSSLSGKPIGVLLALGAASTWALGTQMLRRTTIPVPTLALSFWMTFLTVLVMAALSFIFEFDQWRAPTPTHWASILFNAFLVFGFAHPAWFYLARSLPPVASTLSVMMIPILGVFSGAYWLGEVLHWQDWAAVGLMVLSIASVLWPSATQAQSEPTDTKV
ncbi:MAG: DMT family transporter [Betaproteobacteria bacterium]|jgi:drug/metabolite transporter (DMT)-like permease|nr:DMT family transporter [Betaproteobacteria bacterium]